MSVPLTYKQTADQRFANVKIYTGLSLCGREAVRHFEGMADRGVTFSDTEGAGNPYCGRRPRSMKFDARMYSVNPKDWPA